MIAPRDMGFGKGGALRYKPGQDEDDSPSGPRAPEPTVLFKGSGQPARGTLGAREPWATVRAEPRRFWVGVPMVFLVASAAAWAFREAGIEAALGALLVTQCLGFVALYVPALRKRTDPMRNRLPPRNDTSPIDRQVSRDVQAGGRLPRDS